MSPRKILFPFSLLYGGVVYSRNKLFDVGFLKSKNYQLPIFCVGNLNVGGTGKTPMVEYVLRLFVEDYNVATLSRGYKRSTKGFYLLKNDDTAEKVGDEPLLFKTKFENVAVAVDEDRQNGIAQLLNLKNPEVIVLDDAFQHRKVTAGFNILLTAYNDLYIDDLILPAGNLRESKAGAKRADAIVVTKCPANLPEEKMREIEARINPLPNQKVFFTFIKYAETIQNKKEKLALKEFLEFEFTLVTGIANPKPLVGYLEENGAAFEHKAFPDHHNFTDLEMEEICKAKKILTTEKDYMRLRGRVPVEKLFYLPIEVGFLQNQKSFNAMLQGFVNKKMR